MSDEVMLTRARSAWNAAKRDDDEYMREASEIRLARAWPKPRMSPTRAAGFGAAAAFAVAAVLFLVFGRSHAPEASASSVAPTVSANMRKAGRAASASNGCARRARWIRPTPARSRPALSRRSMLCSVRVAASR